MAKDLEPTALEPLISAVQNAQIALDTTSSDLRAQGEKASIAVREPKSAKALAALYGVSDRTLQDWFKTVCTAYIWLPLTDLKIGSSNKTRYTVLCQSLLAAYRDAAKTLSTDEWIKTVRATHPKQSAFPEPEVTEAELVEAPDSGTAGITICSSTGAISVHQVNQIHLTVINTQPQVDQAMTNLQASLKQWNQNTHSLEAALIQNAENKGSELGTKVAVAKVSKLVQTSEQVEMALAAQLGLLGKPTVAPDASPAG